MQKSSDGEAKIQMIHGEIKISEIDYEQSFSSLFPAVLNKCAKMETTNLLVRFQKKMGEDSITAVLGILELLPQRRKSELLCRLVMFYGQELAVLTNRFLEKDELGRNFKIGDISMIQDEEERLLLCLQDVKVDYNGLMQSELVHQKIGDAAGRLAEKLGGSIFRHIAEGSVNLAANAFVNMAPDGVEKSIISIMEREEVKEKLLRWAEEKVQKKGICLWLEDLSLIQGDTDYAGNADVADRERSENEMKQEIFQKGKLEIPWELEEELLDAAAEYLKSLLKERGQNTGLMK
ncbi:hypothetical protein DXA13_00110 [Clostridium sp. AM58-1XD]|nr:hypothetical protein DXA13_00110 [Clostridium sp. AM58-1XD]